MPMLLLAVVAVVVLLQGDAETIVGGGDASTTGTDGRGLKKRVGCFALVVAVVVVMFCLRERERLVD